MIAGYSPAQAQEEAWPTHSLLVAHPQLLLLPPGQRPGSHLPRLTLALLPSVHSLTPAEHRAGTSPAALTTVGRESNSIKGYTTMKGFRW